MNGPRAERFKLRGEPMSTDNQQQEIWKKFNKQPGAAGAPRLTPEEEKKLNLRQIVIYLALTFLLT